jgi:hypothetical protein
MTKLLGYLFIAAGVVTSYNLYYADGGAMILVGIVLILVFSD